MNGPLPNGNGIRPPSFPSPTEGGRSKRLAPVLAVFFGLLSGAARAAEYELPASTDPGKITFSAEDLEYDKANDVLKLRGRAYVHYSTWTLKAREVDLDMKTQTAAARDTVALEDGKNVVFCDSATVNFERREGTMEGVSAGFSPWYIQAKKLEISQGKQEYEGANLTSCNYVPPHYVIRASKLTIYPGTSLWARNAVFYLGDVPMMYFPSFYRSLRRGSAISSSFELGYDEQNGARIQTATLIKTNPRYYSRLYLDYFTRQGPGTGLELDAEPPGGRSSVLGYRIHERRTGLDRWTVLGNVYQALGSTYSIQGRAQLLSDPQFNTQYLRSSYFQVTPELINNLALTRRTPWTTTRLSYSRRDVQDATGLVFQKVQESAPRLDFITAPYAVLGIPVLHTFTSFAESAFDPSSGTWHQTVQGRYELVKTIPLVRGLALTPRVNYQETYYDQLSTPTLAAPINGAFVGRYGADMDLRWANPLGDTDFDYSYEARMAPNASVRDASAYDYGLDASLLSLTHAIRPSRKVFVRLASGYEMRAFRDRSLTTSDRVQPISAEATWQPRREVYVAAREDYQLGNGSRAFFVQSSWTDPRGQSAGLGVSESDNQPGHYFVHPSVTWIPPGRTWRAAAILRLDISSSARLYEKILTFNKDFHDFATEWQFRNRPGNNSFSFNVHLRVSDRQREQETKPELEREFYPWRRDPEGERR